MEKKYVGYETLVNTWLSLDEYQYPVWFTDLWEGENVLVKNIDERESGWEKVQTLVPCCHKPDREITSGRKPWQFEDCYEEMVDVTHFMITGLQL